MKSATSSIPEVRTELALQALRSELLRVLGDRLLAMYFFGSRCRGRFNPESDTDVLVVVQSKDRSVIETVFEIANRIENDLLLFQSSLSVHIRSGLEYRQFKTLKSPFIQEIEKEGRILYERKPEP